jgi:hypothetical protein
MSERERLPGLRARSRIHILARAFRLASVFLVCACAAWSDELPARLDVEAPARVNPSISVTVTVKAVDDAGRVLRAYQGQGLLYGAVLAGGKGTGPVPLKFQSGVG